MHIIKCVNMMLNYIKNIIGCEPSEVELLISPCELILMLLP